MCYEANAVMPLYALERNWKDILLMGTYVESAEAAEVARCMGNLDAGPKCHDAANVCRVCPCPRGVRLNMLVNAQKHITSREILLWMTPSEAPKALQASACNELLGPTGASCWIFAQH